MHKLLNRGQKSSDYYKEATKIYFSHKLLQSLNSSPFYDLRTSLWLTSRKFLISALLNASWGRKLMSLQEVYNVKYMNCEWADKLYKISTLKHQWK